MKSSVLAIRLAAGGTLVTALAFARDAQSFCRTVSHQLPAGWDPVAQGCFADAGAKALFWKNSCVGYSLNANASRRVTLEQATSVVAAAFEAWTSVACAAGGNPSVHAVDLGPVECGKVQYNRDQPNQNVILFHDDEWPYAGSGSTLGLTTVTFDTTTGELLGADIELNATQNLVVGDVVPSGGYNLASVITHEVGHFLGLAHSAESTAIMFAKYMPVAQLAGDDAEGLCSIYAPGGTRATTDGALAAGACDPTPHGGFSSACSAPGGTSMPGSDSAASRGGCSIASRLPSHVSLEALLGTLSLAWLGVRRRRAAHAERAGRGSLLAGFVVLVTSLLIGLVAHASVSIVISLDDLVRISNAVAIVSPIERRSAWESGRIYTYTRARVEKVVAGDPPFEIEVRTMGGVVGTTGQLVEGEALLEIGQSALLFLRPPIGRTKGVATEIFEVTARAQGQFPITLDENKRGRLASSIGVGALVASSANRVDESGRGPARPAGRSAAEALRGRSVEEATHDIAALWDAAHRP